MTQKTYITKKLIQRLDAGAMFFIEGDASRHHICQNVMLGRHILTVSATGEVTTTQLDQIAADFQQPAIIMM